MHTQPTSHARLPTLPVFHEVWVMEPHIERINCHETWTSFSTLSRLSSVVYVGV